MGGGCLSLPLSLSHPSAAYISYRFVIFSPLLETNVTRLDIKFFPTSLVFLLSVALRIMVGVSRHKKRIHKRGDLHIEVWISYGLLPIAQHSYKFVI